MSAELPSSTKDVKKMERAIAKEAKADEKEYGRALKELKRTEKSEAEAFRAAGKADKRLRKKEAKEHDAIKLLQKATHNHDQAVTNLHAAQSDVQIKSQNAQKLRRNTDTLRTRAEEFLNARQVRKEERNRKLECLQSSRGRVE